MLCLCLVFVSLFAMPDYKKNAGAAARLIKMMAARITDDRRIFLDSDNLVDLQVKQSVVAEMHEARMLFI